MSRRTEVVDAQVIDHNEDDVRPALRAHASYARTGKPLCFWRSTHGYEVDFLVGGRTAIEVKATRKASLRDARGLLALRDEGAVKHLLLVSEDPLETRREGILFLPWASFLAKLWAGQVL